MTSNFVLVEAHGGAKHSVEGTHAQREACVALGQVLCMSESFQQRSLSPASTLIYVMSTEVGLWEFDEGRDRQGFASLAHYSICHHECAAR
jgi:hypothetical protein